jgi:hypothetical protein
MTRLERFHPSSKGCVAFRHLVHTIFTREPIPQ